MLDGAAFEMPRFASPGGKKNQLLGTGENLRDSPGFVGAYVSSGTFADAHDRRAISLAPAEIVDFAGAGIDAGKEQPATVGGNVGTAGSFEPGEIQIFCSAGAAAGDQHLVIIFGNQELTGGVYIVGPGIAKAGEDHVALAVQRDRAKVVVRIFGVQGAADDFFSIARPSDYFCAFENRGQNFLAAGQIRYDQRSSVIVLE